VRGLDVAQRDGNTASIAPELERASDVTLDASAQERLATSAAVLALSMKNAPKSTSYLD
jgi:hypothetical protein